MNLDGVLFFPVTPFSRDGAVDIGVFRDHVASRLVHGPGAVFAACGTGEFHALGTAEIDVVVRAAVDVVDGAIPVFAGVGGPLGQAVAGAREAEDAGVDGLLLLPPYLVAGPTAGLRDYVHRVLDASSLPVVLYHRGTALYTPDLVAELASDPRVIGFKDGLGDLGLTQDVVATVRRTSRDDLHFFNGLLTAEVTQGAYRGIGVPLYSSAAFAVVPEVAVAYYDAYSSGDEARRLELLERFYLPLVRLRDQTPGFGVSLIKAGLRIRGLDAGSVRPPLVDPSPDQMEVLAGIIEAGLAAL